MMFEGKFWPVFKYFRFQFSSKRSKTSWLVLGVHEVKREYPSDFFCLSKKYFTQRLSIFVRCAYESFMHMDIMTAPESDLEMSNYFWGVYKKSPISYTGRCYVFKTLIHTKKNTFNISINM